MRSRRATWLRWVLVFAAAGAIFYASGRPVPAGLVPPLPQSDKLAHAAVYAVLAALLFRALWADETRPVAKGALLLAVVLASAYGSIRISSRAGRATCSIGWPTPAAPPRRRRSGPG